MTRTTDEPDGLGITAKEQGLGRPEYCLMTAAYNEEANIARTIESVLAQSLSPKRWFIVSDGSVDKTDEIIKDYAAKHDFIRFVRMTRVPGRSFGRKVMALQSASKLLEEVQFDFIGNLDADVSVLPTYFEDLLAQFAKNPGLGIAGGFVCDETDGKFQSRRSNRVYSVAHAGQLVRRECYQAIGGYAVLEYGGEDWHAQIAAKMKGWTVESLPELKIFHHRPTGTGDNLVRHKFRQGRMDYSFGSDALFELLKCLERLPEEPFFVGSLARLLGFSWSWIRRDRRPVSGDFMAFLRNEQKQKLKAMMRGSHPSPRPNIVR
jgi:glycosyltransferase involved in cell wall biosynthesis